MARVQRRIAAILAADVVGYSRLMGKDEEGTLSTLKTYREIIDGLIEHHEGRIFGSAGDSIIAEFASPVEAVRCATEIQLEIDKQNTGLSEPDRMRFRIGVNLGDVIVDGSNLMGDGVNVAARLETLSPPGGICISEAIHTQVRDRLSLDFLDLGEHKVKNIDRPVHAYRVPLASEEETKSPFRGLDAFDFEHADLFFGRAQAIAACTDRLEHLAAQGRAFLLIYGMSGSGKSSLLRAGLLPTITKPDAIAGITLWRRCVIRPSEGSDAVVSLIAGLLREGALPEIAQKKPAAELANLFRSSPDRGLALIRSALAKAAKSAGSFPTQARLVVAVDQMEELLTTNTDPSSRQAFVGMLAALAGSGCAWVIGTIRGDFFHRCSEIPGFAALKDGLSSYELLPPTSTEIAQMIREPARAVGLRFEEDAVRGRLEDVLQEAAAADPGSLPLLEFVLDALYESGRGRRLLMFATYRALGGLEGAIARRADEVIDALPADIRDALPAVLRALTTVRLGDEATTVRPAPFADVANTSAKTALVDALIAARLLVSDENAEGQAVIRPAHEALLSRWPRARDIVSANRNFLETRARIQADMRRWVSGNKNPELLLPAGMRLAEGEELLRSRGEEIDDRISAYIAASSLAEQERTDRERLAERARIEAAEAASRARLSMEAAAAKQLARRTRHAAFVAIALAVIAGVGAIIGFRGQQEAGRQAELAQSNANFAKVAEKQAKAAEDKALQARDEALRNQSLSLSSLSQQTAAGGDTEAAILLALEALPNNLSSPERPFVVEAEAALYQALLSNKNVMVFRHDAGVTDAEFSKDGDRIVTSSFDRTARIWNVKDGSGVAVLKGHQDGLERAMFSPDGTQVVSAARDGTARIWNAGSGEQLFVLPLPGSYPTATFNPSGTRVLTASLEHGSAIWDAQSGKQVVEVRQPVLWGYASFSPDGGSFAAGIDAWAVGIWNSQDGKPIKTLVTTPSHPDVVTFSPDGRRVLLSSWGTLTYAPITSHLLDVSSGKEIAALGGHRSDTRSGTFSHDGRLVATVSIDGTARLWDGVTGQFISSLGGEFPGLRTSDANVPLSNQDTNAAFSPNDKFLATASMDGGIHIWDVESGSQFTIIRGHKGLVEHVAFSPTDNLLLTASHDSTARLWDVDGVLTTTLRHQKPPTFAAFSPDGTRVVTGGQNRLAYVWDVATGREIARFESKSGQTQDATFGPDGSHIAIATLSGNIAVWDAHTARQTHQLVGHTAAVMHVQFSPKGDTLLSTSADGTARLWNTLTGNQLAVLKANGSLQKSVFSPDAQLVLTGVDDNTARIWKADGHEFISLIGHEKRITAATFSSDGHLVATGSLDGTAKIWSLPDGRAIATLRGHNEPLTDVAFSHDGQLIVTASRDRTARIWRVKDGTQQTILEGHGGIVNSAVFSPNGVYVVTASGPERTVKLWKAESGQEVAVLTDKRGMTIGNPALTRAVFSPDGTRIVIVSGDERARIFRIFPTPNDLVDYAHKIVPRSLTPCERKRFFLPVEDAVGDCRG